MLDFQREREELIGMDFAEIEAEEMAKNEFKQQNK
jgi:hypothetical protein